MKTIWPRLESDEQIIATDCARPLEDTARVACCELISWLKEMGWDKFEAYQMISQCMEMKIGNMLDPLYTAVLSIPKEHAYKIIQ